MSFNDPQHTPAVARGSQYEERFQANNRAANAAMQCVCGSQHFFQVQTQQFSNRGYGTAQLQSLTGRQDEIS